MNKFEKLKISLRYYLLGASKTDKEFLKCIEALEFASSFHRGLRKDGITPEFEHQLVISHYIRTLINNLEYPCETIITTLLHDVPEDYDVGFDEISNKFGSRSAKSIELLTKFHRGHKKSNDEYFHGISEDPIASICKGGDRIHNLQTMVGVFDNQKQEEYVKEAEEWILPCIKKARRFFPSQELAYENIKLLMESQLQLIKLIWTTKK